MATLLLAVAVACVVANVIFSMIIVHELSKRGVKINILWLRLLIIKYVNQYKRITQAETGKTGSLFYLWIFSINAALVCALAGLALHAL